MAIPSKKPLPFNAIHHGSFENEALSSLSPFLDATKHLALVCAFHHSMTSPPCSTSITFIVKQSVFQFLLKKYEHVQFCCLFPITMLKWRISMSIDAVRKKHENRLMRLPNVVGVGIGEKDDVQVIQVFVTAKVPLSALRSHEVIPERLDSYATDVLEIGHVVIQKNVKNEGG